MNTTTESIQVEFDANSLFWSKQNEYNMLFLRAQEGYLNDLLKARGYVFLNDLLAAVGVPLTKTGQISGWKLDAEHPVSIDFGLDASDIKVDSLIRLNLNFSADILDALL